MLQQEETTNSVHVNYHYIKVDVGNATVDGLEITTPLAILVIVAGFNPDELEELKDSLKNQFQYDAEDIVTLQIPNFGLDFILITYSSIEKYQSGCALDNDCDGENDDYELQVAEAVMSFVNGKNWTDDCGKGCGQLCSGNIYTNPVLQKYFDDEEIVIKDDTSCDPSISYTVICDNGKYVFNFHMVVEPNTSCN